MKINIESHQVMKFWAAEVTGNYWFVASCFELIRAASIVIPPVDPKNTFMRGLGRHVLGSKKAEARLRNKWRSSLKWPKWFQKSRL